MTEYCHVAIIRDCMESVPESDMDETIMISLRAVSDHIAELERLLRRYRTETPLGHQPHMIAHEVDAILGKR